MSLAFLASAVAAECAVGQTSTAGEPQASAPGEPDVLQEVVVTAERKPDTIQKAPLAIEAFTADSLREMGNVADTRDLAVAVPSVHVTTLGVYSNVYINGVGGGVVNAYGSPAVSFSMDGVFIDQAAAPASALYDIQRLELVKGPQGTLYGRNATAGALNVLPNRPTFTDEGDVAVAYGNYNDTQTSGMLNIPLASNLAARFAFSTRRHDGYLSNGADDDDSQAGRAQLLWRASDALTLLAYVDAFHEGGVGQQSVPLYPGADLSPFGTGAIAPGVPAGQEFLNPRNPWTQVSSNVLYPSLIPPPYPQAVPLSGGDAKRDHNQYVTHLQADWDLGFATLTVLPALVSINDDDIFYENGYRTREADDITQSTVEARLASDRNSGAADRLQWVAGLYWFHTRGDSSESFFQEGVSDITLSLPDMTDESKAVFGQATWSIVDSVRITGGARYTSESKSESGQTVIGNLFLFPPPTAATCQAPFTFYPAVYDGSPNPARCGVPNAGQLSFSSTDYKAGLEVDLTPQNMLYLNDSTGFKAGGFNPGTAPNTYPPERLRDFDIGTKNRFLDNTLQVNASAFYWHYQNQQQQAFGPINPSGYAFIVYPSDSHIYGASIDAKMLVTHNDTLAAEVDYLYGVYDRYTTAAIPSLGIPAVNGAGAERPYTPRWTEHLDYTHVFRLGSGATVDIDANSIFIGREYVYTTPDIPIANQGSYHRTNGTLAYNSSDARWRFAVYANNIENKLSISTVQPSSSTGNYFAYLDPPRTYGFRVSHHFQ